MPVELEDPTERIRRLFGFFANEVLESPLGAIPKLVISEADNFPEIARFYVKEVISRGRAFVTQTLRQGVESGIFRPLNPDHVFYSLVGPMLLARLAGGPCSGPYYDRTLDAPAMIDNASRHRLPRARPSRRPRCR